MSSVTSYAIKQQGGSFDLVFEDRFELVFLIGRTARLSRFVRPAVAVEVTRQLSFYTLFINIKLLCLDVYEYIIWRCRCLNSQSEESMQREAAAATIQRLWRYTKDSTGQPYHPSQRSQRSLRHSKRRSIVRTHLPFCGPDSPSHASNKSRQPKSGNSQVGATMRELTAQRMAIGILAALLVTVAFSFRQRDLTPYLTSVLLHNQTQDAQYAMKALRAARIITPNLLQYTFANGSSISFPTDYDIDSLRESEVLNVTISPFTGNSTTTLYVTRDDVVFDAFANIVAEIFMIVIWITGVM